MGRLFYTEFFNRDIFFNFSISTIIDRYFLLLHSWMIFLTSGTLYGILRLSSLFLNSRNKPLNSYYNKTTKRKCVTLSNLKLLLCFFLFQLLNIIDIHKLIDFRFMIVFFPEKAFTIIIALASLSENVSRNEWNVFKKRWMHFIHININILLSKIDKVRYIANVTSASIIWISETKLDETILSNELEVDGYDLVRLVQSRRGIGVACYIKISIAYRYKDSFCSNTESIFVDIFCLNLGQYYWVSYIDHPINLISLRTLIMFSQKLGF